jgi:hypothetical protein
MRLQLVQLIFLIHAKRSRRDLYGKEKSEQLFILNHTV